MALFDDHKRGWLVRLIDLESSGRVIGIVIKRTRTSMWGPFDFWDILVGDKIVHIKEDRMQKL